MMDEFKIILTPEDEAMYAFDFENGVLPVREIAGRIAAKYGNERNHPLVDDISNAIEDARALGRRDTYVQRSTAEGIREWIFTKLGRKRSANMTSRNAI